MGDDLELEIEHLINQFQLDVDIKHCIELASKVKVGILLVSELDGGLAMEWRNGHAWDIVQVFSNRIHVHSPRTLLEEHRDYVTGENAEQYKISDETFVYLKSWSEILDNVAALLNRQTEW